MRLYAISELFPPPPPVQSDVKYNFKIKTGGRVEGEIPGLPLETLMTMSLNLIPYYVQTKLIIN